VHIICVIIFLIPGDLVDVGITIVSGLAPGIDTAAHQATVERGKRTIAVLGTGPDDKSLYPQSNLKLAEKILKTGGALVSEYAPGTPGSKITFPKRNRIIAGFSIGILVVEAPERSGALITARDGIMQKKKLFAVPGSIYSSNSRGTHSLLKKGALLVENANDILKELDITPPERGSGVENSNPEEKLILDALREGALYVDKIIEKTNIPAPKTVSTLSILEISGRVRNLGGNVYARMR